MSGAEMMATDPLDAPRWARALLAADRAAQSLLRAEAALRDELLCALLDEAARGRLTASIYAREGTYRAGSRLDREGLMSWEREALDHPCVPRGGAALVAGCGGGRELVALRERGFRVVGFDPCEALVGDARARFAGDDGARCELARLEELPLATRSLGPLGFLRATELDLVLLGWTSLSYLADPSTRAAVMSAVKALAPRAPVLLSAWGSRGAREGRARAWVRRGLSALGREAPPGLRFHPWTGFLVELDLAALQGLARDAGYSVRLSGAQPSPWALLTP